MIYHKQVVHRVVRKEELFNRVAYVHSKVLFTTLLLGIAHWTLLQKPQLCWCCSCWQHGFLRWPASSLLAWSPFSWSLYSHKFDWAPLSAVPKTHTELFLPFGFSWNVSIGRAARLTFRIPSTVKWSNRKAIVAFEHWFFEADNERF